MSHRKKLDKIIVVDCECTCWSTKEEQGAQCSEIIQIGVCSLNLAAKTIGQEASYLIKPKYSTVSEYCTALTGITQKNLKGAMSLFDACNLLMKKFGTRNRVWSSYGNGDGIKFREDCIKKVADYPFGGHYIDTSLLFHIKYLLNSNISLTEALKLAGFEFYGTQHNAMYDAYNTAVLLKHLIT